MMYKNKFTKSLLSIFFSSLLISCLLFSFAKSSSIFFDQIFMLNYKSTIQSTCHQHPSNQKHKVEGVCCFEKLFYKKNVDYFFGAVNSDDSFHINNLILNSNLFFYSFLNKSNKQKAIQSFLGFSYFVHAPPFCA